MERFGFKNFKKFKDFPMIDLAPITLVVGPNNSGKSSFIKAVLLLIYNLNHVDNIGVIDKRSFNIPFIDTFSFFNNTTTNFGWGDYSSSLNHNAINENMTFRFTCGAYEFEFEYGLFNPIGSISPYPHLWSAKIKSTDDRMLKIEYYWDGAWKCDKYSIGMKFLQDWAKNRCLELTKPYDVNGNGDYVIDMPAGIESEFVFISQLIEKANAIQEDVITNAINDDVIIKGIKECLSPCLNELKEELKYGLIRHLIYIDTHNAPHRSALDINDKNNYVAQTVSEYLSKSSLPFVDQGHKFVVAWLQKFKIGKRFLIKEDYNGEILSVDIIHDIDRYQSDSLNKSGSYTNLGNMGTGTIQIFTMLLKLAIAIEESKKGDQILVIIEEPEQNLHPAFQSKLADLFKEVYDMTEGRVRFIVETHSEYLIRRSQVLVAEEHYADEEMLEKENPFKVYYFPEEGTPYDMKYKPNGFFKEAFGEGFFDEAGKWSLTLTLNNRR